MLKLSTFIIALLATTLTFAQVEYDDDPGIETKTAYRCFIDLTKVHDDKLTVMVYLPKSTSETVEYRMPRIVPGTYSVYDFGRFVSNFTAFDNKGKKLPVTQTDKNGWQIEDATSLTMVTYDVDDTWDDKDNKNFIFEPAGTNIQPDTNFTINTFGFFGYLKDRKEIPYELHVTKPMGFYASTGAADLKTGPTNDVLKFSTYHDLADSPIMYCKPDTTWLTVGNSKILVSVFSPNKKADSKTLGADIKQILEAQRNYLGGNLPVKKYAFIINLYKGYFSRSGSYGALEHSYSSFYFLPEMQANTLAQTVRDISAHEFFHIVTPLNIHSEEIQNFDYDKPKMSAHLWLYEGVTEYSATHVQIKYGLMELPDYLDVLLEKVRNMGTYNDSVPFTTMSLGCLDKYEDQYQNVYEKGALIGLCLDIKLRALSDGKYGIQNLMADLAKKYGKNTPFKDDLLFDEIAKLTHPEIGTFLKDHVGGNKPLPLKEVFDLVGLTYSNEQYKQVAVNSYFIYEDSDGLFLGGVSRVSDRPCDLKLEDRILTVDGKKVTRGNATDMLAYIKKKALDDEQVTFTARHQNGETVETTCPLQLIGKGRPEATLQPNPGATPQQLKLRKAWINQ